MLNFAVVESLFSDFLIASKGDLSDSEREEVQSFLDVGEYGLALETAVDIYVEEKRIPLADVVSLFEMLATAMSMKSDLVLARLIKLP